MAASTPEKARNISYTLAGHVKEAPVRELYGTAFCHHIAASKTPRYIFAVAGGPRASVYEYHESNQRIQLLQAYVDEQKDECFYTCAWTCSAREDQGIVLAIAGANAIIRLVSLADFDNFRSLQGHGHAINELQFHPTKAHILASASKDWCIDHTVRLWNINTSVCVCVFGGENGHRDEVLSLDFNADGTKLVSCGMDHNVKLWDLSDKANQRIADSDQVIQEDLEKHAFPPLTIHFPIASTSAVHRNYVDCVRWFGDCFVTKSTENQVACWKFGGDPRLDLDDKRRAYLGDPITMLSKFNLKDCEVWYLRFCFHPDVPLLSVGNTTGVLHLFNLNDAQPGENEPTSVLTHPKCNRTIRQVEMSLDGRYMVAVCDDATIWCWRQTEAPSS